MNSQTLPSFDSPPVVEVTAGVQFQPLLSMSGPTLGPLRVRWRDMFPLLEEQPALPPFLEADAHRGPAIQFSLSPVPPSRFIFSNPSGSNLVQLQNDRLIVNWRRNAQDPVYPRYRHIRSRFEDSHKDLTSFVAEEGLGSIVVNQVELSYINQIEENLQSLADPFAGWAWTVSHHLGKPSRSRSAATFEVPDLGVPPVRLHVSADPATDLDGRVVTFFTLTVRGAPVGSDLNAALGFLDRAHDHIVNSFTELTTVSMHEVWRRTS